MPEISHDFILKSLASAQHGMDLEQAAQWLKLVLSGDGIPADERDEAMTLANRFFLEAKVIRENIGSLV